MGHTMHELRLGCCTNEEDIHGLHLSCKKTTKLAERELRHERTTCLKNTASIKNTNLYVLSFVYTLTQNVLWALHEKWFVKIYKSLSIYIYFREVTPSYINAYTCAQDLFIRGLFTLQKRL